MKIPHDWLDRYSDQVILYNEKLNLVSRRNTDSVIARLISESLVVLDWKICRVKSPMLDIGTGGGIPGIPIKIMMPDLCVDLLDSNHRKTLFLRKIVQLLSLEHVDVICDRVENIVSDFLYREHFNTVVSRGVAPLENLLRWGSILLKSGGELIVWKGSRVDDEMTGLDLDGWIGPEFRRLEDGPVLVRLERRI